MLKLLGTLETDLSPDEWSAAARSKQWTARCEKDRLKLERGTLCVELEGTGFTLLYGSLANMEKDLPQLLALLAGKATILQIDVFEEDGRMIKRITG